MAKDCPVPVSDGAFCPNQLPCCDHHYPFCLQTTETGICGNKYPCREHKMPYPKNPTPPAQTVCLELKRGIGSPGVCGQDNCQQHKAVHDNRFIFKDLRDSFKTTKRKRSTVKKTIDSDADDESPQPPPFKKRRTIPDDESDKSVDKSFNLEDASVEQSSVVEAVAVEPIEKLPAVKSDNTKKLQAKIAKLKKVIKHKNKKLKKQPTTPEQPHAEMKKNLKLVINPLLDKYQQSLKDIKDHYQKIKGSYNEMLDMMRCNTNISNSSAESSESEPK